MSFLKAEWRKLALANYEVDPKLLEKYIPKGTELDLWNNRCYVSLVGFMFLNTKVLGIKIPFHVNFEEVNLRFYVKRIENNEVKRGVVFVKEIVPKAAISFVANTVYREHYQTMKMDHTWEEQENTRKIEYKWKSKKKWNSFKVITDLESKEIEESSETEFITEHYWGYAKYGENKTNEYEVTHPRWQHYPVQEYEINVDFEDTYGPEFAFLNKQKPTSIMLAEGSKITVEKKKSI